MTPKRWLALLAFYITYLLFGASIYYTIENQLETEKRNLTLHQRKYINELLVNHLSEYNASTQQEILEKVSEYCEKPVTNHTLDEYEEPYRWTFYHSLFFAFTVCSTVGYGNLAPSTTLGQMIMIVYSLIGIPINGILFAGLGEFFSRTFTGIYQKYKNYKMSNDDLYVPRQFGLFATVLIALVPGITFFIILPAVLFSYFEGWPYTLSIYFSYVTTTTIGFGDYVPTFQPHQEHEFGIKFIFYQIFIIVWFIFSLGYLLMIMTFITKGFRSKKLTHLEHQLSVNIKATQSRIWNGVTKDVGYLRRILNELYIMKFKMGFTMMHLARNAVRNLGEKNPVYHEPGDKHIVNLLPRSASCPEITMYRVYTPVTARKRAFSENLDAQSTKYQLDRRSSEFVPTLVRGSSDTNLEKINKQKSFETAKAFMQTTDLLAKVVIALGNIRPPEEELRSLPNTITANGMINGYHGLSDSQILASEQTWSGWSISQPDTTIQASMKRPRACSDFHITPDIPKQSQTPNEWTWGGDNDQIQQVINKRVRTIQQQDDLYRASFQSPAKLNRSVVLNVANLENKDPQKTITESQVDNKSILKRIKPFKKRPSEDYIRASNGHIADIEAQNYLSKTSRGRDSRASTYRYHPNSTVNRRGSMFSIPSQEEIDQEVLETTTIADLIRALEVMHTHANIQQSNDDENRPKRKMGTASLTPPSLPPLLTLFPQSSNESPASYSRRSTIFNSLTGISPQHTVTSRNMLMRPPTDPPPYSEMETPKLKRRFSIRPTNLQTPPGMAPSVNAGKSQSSSVVHTALQRKLSLRPSPLARELPSTESSSTVTARNVNILNRHIPTRSSLGRISTSHTPLSRLAQLQASRQGSSLSESNATTERTRTESK